MTTITIELNVTEKGMSCEARLEPEMSAAFAEAEAHISTDEVMRQPLKRAPSKYKTAT